MTLSAGGPIATTVMVNAGNGLETLNEMLAWRNKMDPNGTGIAMLAYRPKNRSKREKKIAPKTVANGKLMSGQAGANGTGLKKIS